MDRPDIEPATAEASPRRLPADRRPGQGPAPSQAMLALRHIGLRLGITILIAAAIQLACDWSGG